MEERLQNILSHRGVASRRAAATLIEEGRVLVDGQIVREPGARFDPALVEIAVDGRVIAAQCEKTRTIMMYKPAGVLSTVSDPFGCETVLDVLRKNDPRREIGERLVPVGRLDKDSEGLLILSNDGDLTLKLTHPRYEHEKTYIVRAAGRWNEDKLRILRGPVTMPDGYVTNPVPVEVIRTGEDNVHVLCFKLREGRKRQIRYMCSAAHLVVLSLKRVAVGALRLPEDLEPGHWKELSPKEIAMLTENRPTASPTRAASRASHPNAVPRMPRVSRPNAFWSLLAVLGLATVASAATLLPGQTDVVLPPASSPTARFAATEMTNFLAQVLGAPVPIVAQPAADRTALVLGANALSRAAGLAPEKLKRDGSIVKAVGKCVYICGVDDEKEDPARALTNGFLGNYERATLFGVYEFLHRHAGVRFYFPGELGTYVPRVKEVVVPEGETTIEPDFSYRDCYISGAGVYPGVPTDAKSQNIAKALYRLRLRESTFKIPCCHGQNRFRIAERFSETHPEYFQLRKDGTRCVGTEFKHGWQGRQLCHTSPVWDIFRREAVERVRKGEPWVDVMPQDGMSPCQCPTCQATFNTTNFSLASGYATELIWSNTVSVAQAITAAGLKGGVSQMAYGTYRDIPSVAIPENVAVVLAVGGPWSLSHPDIRDRQIDFIRVWAEKLGRKVAWIWTYPMKNYGRLQCPDVPQHAPRAYIDFYRRAAPYMDGSFVESNQGHDSVLYNYLNYYVWSRFAWNHGEDVEATLAEHNRLMFGAGAPLMTKFFDGLEKKWIGEIAIPSLIGETEIGPWLTGPTEKRLWTEIWSKKELSRFRNYLYQAAKAVPEDSMEAKRIKWIRRSFFEPMAHRQALFADRTSVQKELARRAAYPAKNMLEGAAWSGGVRDTNVTVTGKGAIRLDAKDGNKYVSFSVKNKLKPNTTYRLSYFLKTDLEGRGACMEYEEYTPSYRAEHVPLVAVRGKEEWTHYAGTFKTGADVGTAKDRSTIWLRIFKGTGSAWFDGMSLTEKPGFDPADLQDKIDAASMAGGGVITVPAGEWQIRPLELRSNVTLHLDRGATLVGDPDGNSYRAAGYHALIQATGVENVAIEGEGTIYGQGGLMPTSGSRPHLVDLWDCRNVRVEGVTLKCGGSWTLFAKRCDGVVYRKVKIWSHITHCNDGMDVSSKNVLIEDCDVDADDDALVFKTPDPDIVVENVEVRNCRFASSCNALKFGTETHGRMRNIHVHDCVFAPPSAQGRFDWRRNTPGVTEYLNGLSGIAIESVDGQPLENVTIRNIQMTGYQTPIFVRLGRRHDNRNGETPCIRNVLIENVTGTALSRIACSITGVPGLRVDGVTLRNVALTLPGGGLESDLAVPVPEVENRYPDAHMFNHLPLPGYAFYVRHADNIHFENVSARLERDEGRPAVVLEDARATFDRCTWAPSKGAFSGVYTLKPETLKTAERRFWEGLVRPEGYVFVPETALKPPLFVWLGAAKGHPNPDVYGDCRKRGWAMLQPFAADAAGVLAAVAKLEGSVDVERIYVKGDNRMGALALELLAAAPTKFAGVNAVQPLKSVTGLEAAAGTPVQIVAAAKNPTSVAAAIDAFNQLAGNDAVAAAVRDELVRKGTVPNALRFRGKDGDYPKKQRPLIFRQQAAGATLSVADVKRVGIYQPMVEWLAQCPPRRTGAAAKRRLVLAGDSTLAHRSEKVPAGSWGEALVPYLAQDVELVNCAIGGRSTRTFRPDWEKTVLDKIRPGDWVIIQFGHNDMSKASDPKVDRQTHPDLEYVNNLVRYVADVRLKGARPLLVTSISLYLYDKDPKAWPAKNPLARWVAAMKRVAHEFNVPIVDLNATSLAAVRDAGSAVSSKWYMYSVNGKDRAHPTKAGAAKIAELFVKDAQAAGVDFLVPVRK